MGGLAVRDRGELPVEVVRDGELVVALSFAEYDLLVRSFHRPGRLRNGALVDPTNEGRVLIRGRVDELDFALDYLC